MDDPGVSGNENPLPMANVTPATLIRSESSDDSTFLEDACQIAMAPPSGAEVTGSGERKFGESSVSSSTDFPHLLPPLPHTTCPNNCGCVETQNHTLPDSSSLTPSYDHPQSGELGERGALKEGLPHGENTQISCRSSSDRLIDMVAGMSVDEDTSTAATTSNIRNDSTPEEAAQCVASSSPDMSSSSGFPIQLTVPDHRASKPRLAPADLEGREEGGAWGWDLQQHFKPSSFSTPVQSAGSSSRLPPYVTIADLTLPFTRPSNNMADSVTRLDFLLSRPSSRTMCSPPQCIHTAATPPLHQITSLPSPPKSILKKQAIHLQESWSERTARGASKCVTFNLPDNYSLCAEDSSLLARETPLELWTSAKPTSQQRLREDVCLASIDKDGDSVLARETPVDQWQGLDRSLGCGSSVRTNDIALTHSTEPRLRGSEAACLRDGILALDTPLKQRLTFDALSDERQTNMKSAIVENTSSVLTSEIYEDIWKSLNCSALVLADEDCDSTCEGNCSEVLADETPPQLWPSLTTSHSTSATRQHLDSPEIPETNPTTSNRISCDCGMEAFHSREDVSVVPSIQIPVHLGESLTERHRECNSYQRLLASHQDREASNKFTGRDWMTQKNDSNLCVLAMETPVHMWTSPTIKMVDNTFKHL